VTEEIRRAVKLAAAHPAAELRGMQGAAALLSR